MGFGGNRGLVRETWETVSLLPFCFERNEVMQILYHCKKLDDFRNLDSQVQSDLLNMDRYMLRQNRFLGKGTARVKILTFDLPRMITCPYMPSECQYCYQLEVEKMHEKEGMDSQIRTLRKKNLVRSMSPQFVDKMSGEILRKHLKEKQELFIRIHSSGDFYDMEYLLKWIEIALKVKKESPFGERISFVAYTKAYHIIYQLLEKENGKIADIYRRLDLKGRRNVYSVSDLGIKFLISRMDSTDVQCESYRYATKKLWLPTYYATFRTMENMIDCKNKTCVDCLRCYPPKEDVITMLRTR